MNFRHSDVNFVNWKQDRNTRWSYNVFSTLLSTCGLEKPAWLKRGTDDSY